MRTGNGRIYGEQVSRDELDDDTQDNLFPILQDSAIRTRSISRNRPRPDSMRYVYYYN